MNVTHDDVLHLISVMDLTYLGHPDPQKIDELCSKACTPWGDVAAVCVYPDWLSTVRDRAPSVRAVGVVNFPSGMQPLAEVEQELQKVLDAGADEVDVVVPWQSYANRTSMDALSLLKMCRRQCGSHVALKAIIESGMLTAANIKWACQDALEADVDFIKTSTGKAPQGATLEAVAVICDEITKARLTTGVKASGGIQTVADALAYVRLVEQKMGHEAIHPSRFRLGVSKLLPACEQLLSNLGTDHN